MVVLACFVYFVSVADWPMSVATAYAMVFELIVEAGVILGLVAQALMREYRESRRHRGAYWLRFWTPYKPFSR
jgi:acetyl-CoA acetyltransferase